MAKIQKITLTALEAIAEQLKALPEQEPEERQVGKQEAIVFLKGEIEAVRQRGYSFEQISEYLRGGGLDIGSTALKSYLARAKAAPKAKKAPRKATSKAPTEVRTEVASETDLGAKIKTQPGTFKIKSDTSEI